MKAAVTAAALGLGAAWLWARSNARGSKSLEGTFAPSVEITQDAKKTSPVYERNQTLIKKLGALCPDALKWLGSVDPASADKAALACGIIEKLGDSYDVNGLLKNFCESKVLLTLKGQPGTEAYKKAAAKYSCETALKEINDFIDGDFALSEASRIAGVSLACGAALGPVVGAACFGAASIEAALSGRGGPTVGCFKLDGVEWVEVPCDGKCDKERGPCGLFSFRNSETGRLTCSPLKKGPRIIYSALGFPLRTEGETYYLFERDDETCRWHQREATPREIELYGQ